MAARRMGYRVHTLAPEHFAQPPERHCRRRDRGAATTTSIPHPLGLREGVDVITFEFENVPAGRRSPPNPCAGQAVAKVENPRSIACSEKWLKFGSSIPRRATRGRAFAGRSHCRREPAWTPMVHPQDRRTGLRRQRAGDNWSWCRPPSRPGNSLATRKPSSRALVDLEREISVIAARGVDGQMSFFEPFENVHANHILDVTTAPAGPHRRRRRHRDHPHHPR